MQTTGFAPTHAPAWHVSVRVHELPSLHAVPFALGTLMQAPVVGLHDPVLHASLDPAQFLGVPLTQVPAPTLHVSTPLQALPSSQSASVLQAQVVAS